MLEAKKQVLVESLCPFLTSITSVTTLTIIGGWVEIGLGWKSLGGAILRAPSVLIMHLNGDDHVKGNNSAA